MTTEKPNLTIHVLGAGKGESIVIQLPNGRWGVVDCYSSSLDDIATNATYGFLVENAVEELEFICMTHPHDDHYRGIGQLLDRFRTRYFWHSGSQSVSQFKAHVNYVRCEAEGYAADSGRAYLEIWQKIDELRRQKLTRLKESRPTTVLYPVPLDENANFRIVGLAPSGNQAAIYHRGFLDCFDDEGRFKKRLPHDHQNRISVALLLEYGSTRIVLGGDVESPGWADVLQEISPNLLDAALVKVSHHGSTNGYCPNLWKYFSASQKPLAVVTSYVAQGLPRRNALDHISS